MKRRALFVGVNQYKDKKIRNLSCAVNDATDLHGFFRFGVGYDNVKLLINPADKKEILEEVRKLTSGLEPGDFFLFFFAGHGLRVGENHVLVCSDDFYEDLKYQDDGLFLRQIKRYISGSFDSALILDACQSDILDGTRGVEKGITDRDIEQILDASHADNNEYGSLSIVTSCDEGQTAIELSERQHGLFTAAMLDLLEEARKDNIRIDFSDSFRTSLIKKMSEISSGCGLQMKQRPRFNCVGNSCSVILDGNPGTSTTQVSPSILKSHTSVTPIHVSCPQCGSYNLITDTFRCKICGREYLCKSHSSNETGICIGCVESAKKQKEKQQSKENESSTGAENHIAKNDLKNQKSANDLYVLANNYYYGKNGVAKDESKAVEFFVASAEQGCVCAQYSLGVMYYKGRCGIQKDYTKSAEWFMKAANQGNVDAQYNLGNMYKRGLGVQQDFAKAFEWYSKAAEKGYARAQYNLGLMYYNGDGDIRQDYTKAFEWFMKAANQMEANALYYLGVMYKEGKGVKQDDVKAIELFTKASELGCKKAKETLEQLRK